MSCLWESGSDAEYAWIIRTDAWDGTESVDEEQENAAEISVSLTVQSVDETKRGQSVLAELNNESEDVYTYGEEYTLKKVNGEETETLPMLEGVAWIEIAHLLEGNQSVTMEYLVEECFGKIDPGDYVIEKELIREGTGEVVTVTAEFQIAE